MPGNAINGIAYLRSNRSTDQVTTGRGYTAFNGTASIGNVIPRTAEILLQDFFELCQYPNAAEREALFKGCRLRNAWVVDQWCLYTTFAPICVKLTLLQLRLEGRRSKQKRRQCPCFASVAT